MIYRLSVTGNGLNYSLIFHNHAVAFDVWWDVSKNLIPKGFNVVLNKETV
jgi:hypothetical protein